LLGKLGREETPVLHLVQLRCAKRLISNQIAGLLDGSFIPADSRVTEEVFRNADIFVRGDGAA
jgi:hypothetical protein